MGIEPQALQNRPKLEQRLMFYYSAYNAVSSSRRAGMGGPMSIPVSEILAYCQLFYIDNVNERERLFGFINVLDSAYLEHVAAKQKKSSQ